MSLIEELFQPGNVFQIEHNDSNGKITSYSSRVLSFENNLLQLVVESEPVTGVFHFGTKLLLIYQTANGKLFYYFTAKYLRCNRNDTETILVLSNPERTDVTALRRFFRCDVSLPFSYVETGLDFEGTIVDLSASGLLAQLNATTYLTCNEIIECQIKLPAPAAPLSLKGKVVRITRKIKNEKQKMALHFEEISEKEQNQIIKYLFNLQRELRSKKAGL